MANVFIISAEIILVHHMGFVIVKGEPTNTFLSFFTTSRLVSDLSVIYLIMNFKSAIE